MIVDFIYKQLRAAIIESYTSGDFDNRNNQLNLSLHYLDVHYNRAEFVGLDNLQEKKRRLLTQIQASVDEHLGLRIYNRSE